MSVDAPTGDLADSISVPCGQCGSPKHLVLGRQAIECSHCGSASPLDRALTKRLRAHVDLIVSTLEVMAIDRRKAAEARASAQTVRLGAACFVALMGSCYSTCGLGFHGIGGVVAPTSFAVFLGIFGYLTIGWRRRVESLMVPAPDLVVRVRCAACGAEVPTVGAAVETDCPFCSTPLALSARAAGRAEGEAEDLAQTAVDDVAKADRELHEASEWLDGRIDFGSPKPSRRRGRRAP